MLLLRKKVRRQKEGGEREKREEEDNDINQVIGDKTKRAQSTWENACDYSRGRTREKWHDSYSRACFFRCGRAIFVVIRKFICSRVQMHVNIVCQSVSTKKLSENVKPLYVLAMSGEGIQSGQGNGPRQGQLRGAELYPEDESSDSARCGGHSR